MLQDLALHLGFCQIASIQPPVRGRNRYVVAHAHCSDGAILPLSCLSLPSVNYDENSSTMVSSLVRCCLPSRPYLHPNELLCCTNLWFLFSWGFFLAEIIQIASKLYIIAFPLFRQRGDWSPLAWAKLVTSAAAFVSAWTQGEMTSGVVAIFFNTALIPVCGYCGSRTPGKSRSVAGCSPLNSALQK